MLMRLLFALVVCAACLNSCTINKDVMFKTDEDYVFNQPVIDSSSIDYRITPTDVITFDLYTNEGAMMLEFTTSGSETPKYGSQNSFVFTVDSEGMVEFPVIGRRYISGMTLREAQTYLEKEYTPQFNSPYAVVTVLNRRAIVFTGNGGQGTVVALTYQGMSVIEAIALASGLADNADASRIKLIRRVNEKQEVYLIDLSTIEGIKYANMSVQSGDIIYVEPTPQIGRELLIDVQPFVSVISGLAIVYGIFSGILR